MPVGAARKELIREVVEEHNVAAAVSLARREGCRTVSDLIRVVDPRMRPSVGLVDCAADAMALVREARPGPALKIK